MAILAGVLAALFAIWLVVVSPGFRKFIFGFIILAAGGIALFVNYQNRQEEKARNAIKPWEVQLRDIRMTNTAFGSRKVIGTVKNLSKQHELSRLSLLVKIYDCPTPTLDSSCETIGQSTALALLSIPPGQVRALESSVYFPDSPKPRNFVWSYSLGEIVAGN